MLSGVGMCGEVGQGHKYGTPKAHACTQNLFCPTRYSKLQRDSGIMCVRGCVYWGLFFSQGMGMLKSRELIEPRRS